MAMARILNSACFEMETGDNANPTLQDIMLDRAYMAGAQTLS